MRKARCCPNRERIESDALLRKLMELLFVYRGMIRVTILKNIALVTYALITLFQGARGGTMGDFRKRPWLDAYRWERGQKRENSDSIGFWPIFA